MRQTLPSVEVMKRGEVIAFALLSNDPDVQKRIDHANFLFHTYDVPVIRVCFKDLAEEGKIPANTVEHRIQTIQKTFKNLNNTTPVCVIFVDAVTRIEFDLLVKKGGRCHLT